VDAGLDAALGDSSDGMDYLLRQYLLYFTVMFLKRCHVI